MSARVEAGRLTAAIAEWSVTHARQIHASRAEYDEQQTANT
ncbi:hypothetical protein [Kribbella sp. NBC_00359]